MAGNRVPNKATEYFFSASQNNMQKAGDYIGANIF